MRIWIIAALTGVLAVIGYTTFKPHGNPEDKEKLIMRAVVELLKQNHFREVKIDDDFSEKLFHLYIDRTDGMKRFFTLGEYDLLEEYQDSLDDQIRNGDLRFFELSYKLINSSVDKVKGWYPEILSQPFDFTKQEYLETDGEKRKFAKDDAELKAFWTSYLKYETLTRLAEKVEDQEKSTDEPEGGKKSLAELESEAREDVKKVFKDWFARLDKVKRSDRFEAYVNSITNVFDPHSDYLNPNSKEDFDISMSGRLEGIGARLQMDGDYTKVVAVIPGGPAWKQKELEVDDRIFKIKQENETEPLDVTGWIVDDVVDKVRGPKGTKVTLTVKKTDGSVRDITIIRDEVILDESFAKSLILDLEGEVGQVGYISLPKFYADFENPNGRSCAEDVETELNKLKEAEVKGVILDLRNNTGGSLMDVVKMAGLFIEQGPIVQVKGRVEGPRTMSDKDGKVVYGGPLIIMVNSQSASASEILAAAMQDYGRAIVVGSQTTFGKGTVQRFLQLDKLGPEFDPYKPLGSLKITQQKFYRVNGGSTQLRGVVPDIILPDNYQFIQTGERELDFPMEWTEITPVTYAQQVVNLEGASRIKSEAEARIQANPQFAKVLEYAKRIEEIRNDTKVPLQLDEFRAVDAARDSESDVYKKAFGTIEGLHPKNLDVDLSAISIDSSKINRNTAWLETIQKDIYLEETMHIMKDLMTIHHKS